MKKVRFLRYCILSEKGFFVFINSFDLILFLTLLMTFHNIKKDNESEIILSTIIILASITFAVCLTSLLIFFMNQSKFILSLHHFYITTRTLVYFCLGFLSFYYFVFDLFFKEIFTFDQDNLFKGLVFMSTVALLVLLIISTHWSLCLRNIIDDIGEEERVRRSVIESEEINSELNT